MKDEALKLALEAAYLAGFNASGEGYNGEYGIDCPEENAIWKKDRDNELTAIKQALAAQPPVQPVAFLANGTRFKLSMDDEGKVNCFWNQKELDGRWVALVAAEDDCHLNLTHPPQRTEERNFCPRCGKRTADLTTIHTCTPPQELI